MSQVPTSRLTIRAIEILIEQLTIDDNQELEARMMKKLMNQLFEVTFIVNEGNYDQEIENFGVVRAADLDSAIEYLSTNEEFKIWAIDTFGIFGDEEEPCPVCESKVGHFHRINLLTPDEMIKVLKNKKGLYINSIKFK